MATQATFTFQNVVGKTTGVAPPKAFLPADAKERYYDESDGLRGYLPGGSSLLEILASRYHYIINGCEYGDENFVLMFLRPVGWGCRLAFYLFSVVFLVIAMMRDTNPISQYTFSRERDAEGVLKNDQTDVFEWFVYVTYIVWVATILTEILTYLVGRGGGGKRPHDGQCSAFPLTLFNRVSLPGGADDIRCAHGMILLLWFLALGASASTMLYATISHMFVKRNSYFMWLFVVFICFEAFAALSDAISIGGIDGLAVQSKPASWLVSFRVVIMMPVTVIVSIFFCVLCNPPWPSV
jgi:hypothetical protein